MKKTTLKTFVFSFIMALFFVMPLTAQRTDGFFNSNDALYANRDYDTPVPITGNGVTNQQFGAPLGSGLLIMVAAGAGYAISRRRRSKKSNLSHSSYILLAFALLLGLTQCKKRVETIAPANQGVFITLNIANDAKHEVVTTGNPYPGSLGKVHFTLGDTLLVGNGEKQIGKLVYDGARFTGTIGANVALTDEDDLHFYFTGGRTPVADLEYDDENYYVYEITDQSETLPVFSYGNVDYIPGKTEYSCKLLNKCALVKFTLPEGSRGDVMVSGMHAVVLFSFNNSLDNIFEPQENLGSITLNRRGDNEGWAILFPQDAVDDATVMVDGNWYTNAVDVPAIHNNDLIVNPVISVSASQLYTPKFSVSSDKAIHFAPGNLQYQAGTKKYGALLSISGIM